MVSKNFRDTYNNRCLGGVIKGRDKNINNVSASHVYEGFEKCTVFNRSTTRENIFQCENKLREDK